MGEFSLIADTHILIWFLTEPEILPADLRRELSEGEFTPIFSVVSIWEIAIKVSVGKLPSEFDPALIRGLLLSAGWEELTFEGDHAVTVASLPLIHGDPFDRALVAQAMRERKRLVTTDKLLGKYGDCVKVIKRRKVS
jgi:PIN domain nuclease of toxin-antitoxin system